MAAGRESFGAAMPGKIGSAGSGDRGRLPFSYIITTSTGASVKSVKFSGIKTPAQGAFSIYTQNLYLAAFGRS